MMEKYLGRGIRVYCRRRKERKDKEGRDKERKERELGVC
jgi:hypothetical protein